MDQNLFELLALLVMLISALALSSVLNGAIELAFFRARDIGQAANRRKQYATTVAKGVLNACVAAFAALLYMNPGSMKEVLPEFASYAPPVSLIAVTVATLISYRLEAAESSWIDTTPLQGCLVALTSR